MPQAPEAGAAGPRHADQTAELAQAVLGCLVEDFKEHGKAAVAKLRESDPKTYLALIARLVPAVGRDGEGGVVVRAVIDLGGGDG